MMIYRIENGRKEASSPSNAPSRISSTSPFLSYPVSTRHPSSTLPFFSRALTLSQQPLTRKYSPRLELLFAVSEAAKQNVVTTLSSSLVSSKSFSSQMLTSRDHKSTSLQTLASKSCTTATLSPATASIARKL